MNTNNHRVSPDSTRPPMPSHWRACSNTTFIYDDDEDDDSIFDIEEFAFSTLDVTAPGYYIPPLHLRSLSADSALFGGGLSSNGDRDRWGNRRRSSMDGGEDDALEFLELTLAEPRRVRRIIANRKSAARSKEKRMKFTTELEKEVQSLQTESADRATEIAVLEKDIAALSAENRELKLHLQSLEEQERLRAAMEESLRNDINRLKMELELPITDDNGAARDDIISQLPPEIQNLLQQQRQAFTSQMPFQQQPQMPNQNQAFTSQMPFQQQPHVPNQNQASTSQMPFQQQPQMPNQNQASTSQMPFEQQPQMPNQNQASTSQMPLNPNFWDFNRRA